MKLYNRERKSEEIAETPDRAGTSSRIQGKVKRGKSADVNSFELLSDDDDDEKEYDINPGTTRDLATLPNEATASNKEDPRKLTNKKKGISDFFTPKIQQKKESTLDGNKRIVTAKQRSAEVEGGDGKQGSSGKWKELGEDGSISLGVSLEGGNSYLVQGTSTSQSSNGQSTRDGSRGGGGQGTTINKC